MDVRSNVLHAAAFAVAATAGAAVLAQPGPVNTIRFGWWGAETELTAAPVHEGQHTRPGDLLSVRSITDPDTTGDLTTEAPASSPAVAIPVFLSQRAKSG